MAEIGRLYAHELHDPEQALVAYTSALCESPNDAEYVAEIEELAGNTAKLWNDVLAHVVEGTKILRDAGIPEPVIEFAYTHHGTQVVEYFWNAISVLQKR